MKTKNLILRKTLGLLLEKGYDGVSVSDIQQTTGLSRGLLYHYFGSQDRLFEEAVENFLNDWLRWDKEEVRGKSVEELIVYTVERYGRAGREMAEYSVASVGFVDLEVLLFETMRQHEGLAKCYRVICADRFAVWKTALLNSFSRGELRSGLNLESVAYHFIYIQEGAIRNHHICNAFGEVIYDLDKGLRDFFEIIRR